MTKDTYLKYRELFEKRYLCLKNKEFLENVNLHDLKTGINNFDLFINIYAYDKFPKFTNIVSSIDRRKRFYIVKINYPALKINLNLNSKISMIDHYEDEFEKIIKHLYGKIIQTTD